MFLNKSIKPYELFREGNITLQTSNLFYACAFDETRFRFSLSHVRADKTGRARFSCLRC